MPQMTAAAYPLVLDGQTYHMTPLTDRDYDELTNWMRSRIIDTARKNITPDMDSDERRELLAAAIENASGVNFGEPRSQQHIKTIDGVARVIFQSCLKRHPRLDYEQFRKLFKSAPNIEAAMAIWKEINLPKKRDDTDDGADGDGAAEESAGPTV